MNNPRAYELFAGHDAAGKPIWSSDFAKMRPLLEWNDHLGTISATYIPALRRYLLAVTDCRGPKRDNKVRTTHTCSNPQN